MRRRFDRWGCAALVLGLIGAACAESDDDPTPTAILDEGGTQPPSDGVEDRGDNAGDLGESDGGGGTGQCRPADVLVVLDRTVTMQRTPSGAKPANTPAGRRTSKWAIALDALKTLAAAPRDQSVAFGVALFPKDDGQAADGGDYGCSTLEALLSGSRPTNPSCEPAEVLLAPRLGASSAVQAALSADTLRLCRSTPIAAALTTAKMELAKTADGRPQRIVLITDGLENCGGGAVLVLRDLVAAGIKTYVVGFGTRDDDAGNGGISVENLNRFACAGGTARDPERNCAAGDAGVSVPVDARSTPLFFEAGSATELGDALTAIGKEVCCGCIR